MFRLFKKDPLKRKLRKAKRAKKQESKAYWKAAEARWKEGLRIDEYMEMCIPAGTMI